MNKHEKFIFRESDPLNGGSPPEVLRQQSPTPNEQFFIRNHSAIPVIVRRSYPGVGPALLCSPQ